MEATRSDVLVIGGGIAGCVAASAVLDEKKSVTMLFPNGGSSEISIGTLDIMGVIPGERPVICGEYEKGIDELIQKYPEHIYGKCYQVLKEGINAILSLAENGGYALKGFDGKNVWVPNMLGTFAVNAYVPTTMYDSVVMPGIEERILVVGVKGNVAFNAKAAAMSYQQYQKKLGGKAQYFSTEIEITGWGDRRKIGDSELADYLDTQEGREEFIGLIQTFCMNNRYHFDKILVPPVLGYLNYNAVLEELKSACGCKVGEVASLGNPVIGYRLTRAVYKGLEQKGAKLIRGSQVKELMPDEDGIQVKYTVGLTDQLHPGVLKMEKFPAVILATGGFVGGGIKARHTDVWVELLNEHLGKVTEELLDRDAVTPSGQEFMRMGVQVNEDMTVRDKTYNGQVFACGNILAGHNFASERSGAGIAVASAYLAGRNAAAKL